MKQELSKTQLESVKRIQYIIDTECGGKQQVLADKTGLGKSSISHYVNHSHAPGNHHAYMIAQAFGLNPMWVMGFDVPMRDAGSSAKYDAPARIILEITKDPHLLKALETYVSLPPDAQQHVLDTIHLLGNAKHVSNGGK